MALIVIIIIAAVLNLAILLWMADKVEQERRQFQAEQEAKILKRRSRGRPHKNAVR